MRDARARHPGWILVLAAGLAAAAPGARAEVVRQALDGERPLALVAANGRLEVREGEAATALGELPAGAWLEAIEAVDGGWVAAGTRQVDGAVELYFLRSRNGRLGEPAPPAGDPAASRGDPVLWTDGGAWAGAAWIEDGGPVGQRVVAAARHGDGWGPVETVSPAHGGAQVDLAAAVLDDGSWLLLWASVEEEQSEIAWSRRGEDGWSEPARLHAPNRVPDVDPAVAPIAGGAIAAWSAYDGRHYRLRMARFDGAGWSPPEVAGGLGSLYPSFHRTGGVLALLFRTVAPPAWTLVELDAAGRPARHAELPAREASRPLIDLADRRKAAGRWLEAGAGAADVESSARWRRGAPPGAALPLDTRLPPADAAPPSAAGQGAAASAAPAPATPAEDLPFNIAAHGDSITQGHPVFDETASQSDPPEEWGYPRRLRDLFGCDGTNCWIGNFGVSGEQTGAGLTRLQAEILPERRWDVVAIMEGINDIRVTGNINAIAFNLKEMDRHNTEAGVDTVFAAITRHHYYPRLGTINFPQCAQNNPPQTHLDPRTEQLNAQIESTAADRNRAFAHMARDVLCPAFPDLDPDGHGETGCFDLHFSEKCVVGHPNGSGFDLLAGEFYTRMNAAPPPGAPAPTAPSGDLCGAPASYDWTKESPDDATWYEVEIRGAAGVILDQWMQETDWRAGFTDVCTGAACSFVSGAVSGPGDYSWQVRGRNPRGHGAWSAATPFAVFDAAPPAVPATGSPGASTFLPQPTFQWTAVAGAASYWLEIDGGAAEEHDAGAVCGGEVCSVQAGSPLSVGAHDWRVRTDNPCGAGPWTALQPFEVLACDPPTTKTETNETVTGTRLVEACQRIEAGNLGAGDYAVDGPDGDVTFHSGGDIVIHNGFRIGLDAEFTAYTDL